MKRTMKNLSLLTMGLLIYSCNEKISPELQTGNSTTVPTATTPEEYYFKVTNNSPTILNYVLHRTGNGHYATDCKISSTSTPLSNDLYLGDSLTAHDNKSYDISCYFETEELSLFFNGLDFKVEASQNTCEYVGYAPFSYYDAIPGATTATFVGFTCEDLVTDGDIAAEAILKGAIWGAGPDTVDCGQMVDTSLPVADRLPVNIPEDNQTLCQFDYEANGGGNEQNCDEGKMGITIYNAYDADPDTAGIQATSKLQTTGEHECGGSILSCVEGAIKQVASLSDTTRGTEIMASEINTAFSKEYSLPALIGVRGGNFDIVNFRRGLAAKDLNYGNAVDTSGEWAGTYSKMFDPNIMEKFAANRYADNTTIINTATDAGYLAKESSGGINKTLYAADPFLGLNGSRVNPFYTFYCLDRAYEIKARIRMVVRDWDRVFSASSSSLELISDANLLASARQDLPSSEEEVPNDPGHYNYFNDRDDWDNLVKLKRTEIGPSVVIEPVVGWWSSGIFPNQGPRN